MRILILSSLLVLAIYTALAVRRIDLSPNAPAPFVEPLRGDADLLAARAQTEIVRLRLSVIASAPRMQQSPGHPLDAAEAAMRLAAPSARAVAVIGDTGALAVAGNGRDLARADAARAADASGKSIWFGPAGPLGSAYLAVKVQTSKGPLRLVAAVDLAPLTRGTDGQTRVLATSDGALIAGSGKGSPVTGKGLSMTDNEADGGASAATFLHLHKAPA